MLLVLTFDRSAPRLNLAVAVGAHFGVGTGIGKLSEMVMRTLMVAMVALAMSGPLLGHHCIEVMATHRC